MKALILNDEINQFHWAMLKSVLLMLSILPVSQGLQHLWHSTDGSSQIMVGFFALSLMSALLVLCFYAALQSTVAKLKYANAFEKAVVGLYRYLPMLSLAGILSFSVTQLAL